MYTCGRAKQKKRQKKKDRKYKYSKLNGKYNSIQNGVDINRCKDKYEYINKFHKIDDILQKKKISSFKNRNRTQLYASE